jgi:CRP/FNR family transcriptional regulator, cyclic AMP receptor protein
MSAFPLAADRLAEIELTFAAVPLLSRLNDRQRRQLARRATTRSYRPEAVIVRQGDTSMAFYVVLSGRIRIEREAETGIPFQVWEVGPAGFFGEMGLIDDEPRAATVIAVEPTECALLARWDFQNELRDDPDIALALLPVLNERIRNLNEQVAQLAGRTGETEDGGLR